MGSGLESIAYLPSAIFRGHPNARHVLLLPALCLGSQPGQCIGCGQTPHEYTLTAEPDWSREVDHPARRCIIEIPQGGPGVREIDELIGRAEERAALSEALAAAHRGAAGVVLLAGEAGVGKSHLLEACLADTRLLVLRGPAQENATPPYGPIAAALAATRRIQPRTGRVTGRIRSPCTVPGPAAARTGAGAPGRQRGRAGRSNLRGAGRDYPADAGGADP